MVSLLEGESAVEGRILVWILPSMVLPFYNFKSNGYLGLMQGSVGDVWAENGPSLGRVGSENASCANHRDVERDPASSAVGRFR